MRAASQAMGVSHPPTSAHSATRAVLHLPGEIHNVETEYIRISVTCSTILLVRLSARQH